MRKLNIRRMVSAALAVLLVMSLTVGAFAVEDGDIPEDGIEAIPEEETEGAPEGETEATPEVIPEAGTEATPEEGAQEAGTETGLTDTGLTDETAPAETTEDDMTADVLAFSDVLEDHGFYTAIMDCAAKGITSGYADGTFRPTNSVTRAQFCVMLSRAFYPNEVKKYDTDEYKKVWFGPNTKALSVAGVLTRTSFQYAYNTSRAMDQVINRYDMATLMTNIMAKKGFSATTAQKTEAQKKIADYKSIPSQYQDAVKNVFALGIITGYSDGTFGGERVMNRGQGCVVIYRMMKYTPATTPGTGSTGTGDTYDDGKTKPGTSTGSGSTSTGNTSSGNTGSTGTGSTGETSNVSKTGLLTNGKPITEANVLAMIQELLKKYPEGMTWNENTKRTGTVSWALNHIAEQYTSAGYADGTHVCMQHACGGLSSLFSDSIFGSGTANPARKVPNNTARPGDIIITLDKNGQLRHVSLATTGITGYDIYTTNSFPAVTELNGGGTNGTIYLSPYKGLPSSSNGTSGYYEVWTRYPTNGTPWTGTTGNTGTSSGNTGSTGSNTTVNWITSNNPCGVCGKTGGQQVRSADGARYVCRTCYEDPSGIGKWFVE